MVRASALFGQTWVQVSPWALILLNLIVDIYESQIVGHRLQPLILAVVDINTCGSQIVIYLYLMSQ